MKQLPLYNWDYVKIESETGWENVKQLSFYGVDYVKSDIFAVGTKVFGYG